MPALCRLGTIGLAPYLPICLLPLYHPPGRVRQPACALLQSSLLTPRARPRTLSGHPPSLTARHSFADWRAHHARTCRRVSNRALSRAQSAGRTAPSLYLPRPAARAEPLGNGQDSSLLPFGTRARLLPRRARVPRAGNAHDWAARPARERVWGAESPLFAHTRRPKPPCLATASMSPAAPRLQAAPWAPWRGGGAAPRIPAVQCRVMLIALF